MLSESQPGTVFARAMLSESQPGTVFVPFLHGNTGEQRNACSLDLGGEMVTPVLVLQ
jgi:hypothetical protein